ncbi:MAG: hypothetical protein E7410_01810 [Ruminococcaceae bacterium]|nr:hypothetical protein [Oscillospiraceae bacterium]
MKKKRIYFSKIKKAVFAMIIIYLIATTLIFPENTINASKDALNLCANVLVPSLFPFFVFSSLLINLGFATLVSHPMQVIMRPVFGVSGKGALCFVLGIISGYPLGAACVCDMYKQGELSKQEAQNLLAFCNNSGPLFIIGCIGASMYQSRQIGITFYIIHIISSVLVGFILSLFIRRTSYFAKSNINISVSKPLSVIIKEAVSGSVNNILLVCGFTVLFSVVISSLKPFFNSSALLLLISGVIEISTGTKNVAFSLLPLDMRLAITSALIGFGGISVYLQVSSLVSGTDLSTIFYITGKILQALISFVISLFVFKNIYVQTYADYIYPIRSYELIDFGAAMKLSLLYMASIIVVMVLFWLIEKVCMWRQKAKHKS